MRCQILFVVAGLAGLGAWLWAEEKSSSPLEAVAWMQGQWELADGDTLRMEAWRRVSDHTMEGVGMTRSVEGELKIVETLRVVDMGGELFYLAKVAQNEFPIAFKMVDRGEDKVVFENAAHDFPTRIEYRRVKPDRLRVSVRGGERGFVLDFVRRPKE